MLDATTSMGKNLRAVEENIASVVLRVKDAFTNITVRVALVAYRDHSEGSFEFKIMDFTRNVSEFIDVLNTVRPYKGGDIPEDVLGALDKTIRLNWTASNKLFFQIGIEK